MKTMKTFEATGCAFGASNDALQGLRNAAADGFALPVANAASVFPVSPVGSGAVGDMQTLTVDQTALLALERPMGVAGQRSRSRTARHG